MSEWLAVVGGGSKMKVEKEGRRYKMLCIECKTPGIALTGVE